MRKLRGQVGDWDLRNLLLRSLEFHLRAANWQRSGGKGGKPKPIDLPNAKGRGREPTGDKPDAETSEALRRLGMVAPGDDEITLPSGIDEAVLERMVAAIDQPNPVLQLMPAPAQN